MLKTMPRNTGVQATPISVVFLRAHFPGAPDPRSLSRTDADRPGKEL